MKELMEKVNTLMDWELNKANENWPLFNSDHEGIAVIEEEVVEAFVEAISAKENFETLKNKVFNDDKEATPFICKDIKNAASLVAAEFIQVAAMAQKFIASSEKNNQKEIDWTKVKVDTPILVRDCETDSWRKRYFAKCENGEVYAFDSGRTSWSSDNGDAPIRWLFTKLADETEIEKEF